MDDNYRMGNWSVDRLDDMEWDRDDNGMVGVQPHGAGNCISE